MFCHVCGRTNHNYGFLASLQQGGFALIGNCCASDIANQDLLALAKRKYSARKNRNHYTAQARDIIDQLGALLDRSASYADLCSELDKRRLRLEQDYPELVSPLRANLKQSGHRLISYELTENPQYKKGGKEPKQITVPIDFGTYRGATFAAAGRRYEILRYEIEASLRSLIKIADHADKNADSEKFVSRFRIEVRDRARSLDALIIDAAAFFESANLQTIQRWGLHQRVNARLAFAPIPLPLRPLTQALARGNYGGTHLDEDKAA